MSPAERNREIGRRISNLRRGSKMTQQDLGVRLRRSGPVVNEIEHGRRRVTLDEGVELAKIFGVDLTYLAGITNGYRKIGT